MKGDRDEHTRSPDGTFHHPFVNQPDHVDSVYFEDSHTLSVKIEQKPGPISPGNPEYHTVSWADTIKEVLTGVSADYRKPMVTYYNLKYVGAIYMGSNQERINVIYDTGSSVFLGETHLCTDCPTPKYDFTDESGGSFSYTGGGEYS